MSNLGKINYLIRKAEKKDYEAIVKLICEYDTELAQEAPKYFEDAILQKNRLNYVFYVAEYNSEIIGLMGYRPDKDGAKNIYWAVWLFVNEKYQRKGIATSLWNKIEVDLKQKNARKCYLDVGSEDQLDAISFHTKNGFLMEGYLKDFWAKDDHMIIFGKNICNS